MLIAASTEVTGGVPNEKTMVHHWRKISLIIPPPTLLMFNDGASDLCSKVVLQA